MHSRDCHKTTGNSPSRQSAAFRRESKHARRAAKWLEGTKSSHGGDKRRVCRVSHTLPYSMPRVPIITSVAELAKMPLPPTDAELAAVIEQLSTHTHPSLYQPQT
jgi:hypothetical protein